MWGAIIAAAISAIASGVGTHLANKRKAQAQEKYEKGINEEVAKIDSELNSNYLDRADARNAIRQVTNATEESMRQLNTDAIRSGATDEAKVAMASKLNKNLAGTIGTLAGIGEQHKDNLRNQKRNLKLGLLGHQYNVDSDTSGITATLQGISNAASTIGAAATTGKTSTDTTTDATTDATATPSATTTSAVETGKNVANRVMATNPMLETILDPEGKVVSDVLGQNQFRYGQTM